MCSTETRRPGRGGCVVWFIRKCLHVCPNVGGIKDAAEIPDGMRWWCRYTFCCTVRPDHLVQGCLLRVVLCGDALQCRGACEQRKEGVHVSCCEGKQFDLAWFHVELR